MTKQEQITVYIDNYISNYVEDEIVVSVAEIRKWPCVADLCENHDSANICKAMKGVKYGKWYISGENDSSSFTMMYTRNVKNRELEGFLTKTEMNQAVSEINAKYVTYQNNDFKIHYPDCHHLFLHGGGGSGLYTIHLNYKSAKKYADLKESGNWNCEDCVKRHGKMR